MAGLVFADLNDPVRYGDLTYEEIKKLALLDSVIAMPLGCTEQQGPHLPVDFDTWFAESLMLAAAEQVERTTDHHVLVLPALPLGPTPEHRSYGAGYLDLPEALHDRVVEAAVTSVVEQGFRQVVIWRGCGQHDLHDLVTKINKADLGADVHLPQQPFNDIWCSIGDPSVPGGHADSFTTAIALARRPESVRLDRIPEPSRSPNWNDPNLDFGMYSDSGVMGDPRHGSKELGERLWQSCVDWVTNYMVNVAAVPEGTPPMPG